MTTTVTEDLRFPIGPFKWDGPNSPEQRAAFIHQIAQAPDQLQQAVDGLTREQLNTPYRPRGWTVRQVVHHLPDSHMNAYVRFKLALTETEPLIKPYDEARWAELPDSADTPIEVSLALFESLHDRLVRLLATLRPEDWSRNYRHPEMGLVPLDKALAMYAWHGAHHVAHINNLRARNGW